jgi:hypothetical protein
MRNAIESLGFSSNRFLWNEDGELKKKSKGQKQIRIRSIEIEFSGKTA